MNKINFVIKLLNSVLKQIPVGLYTQQDEETHKYIPACLGYHWVQPFQLTYMLYVSLVKQKSNTNTIKKKGDLIQKGRGMDTSLLN